MTQPLRMLLEQYPETLAFHPFDMADVDGIHGLVKAITGAHGQIYGLVNNAAIGLDGVLGTMHNSDIERALRINTLAPIVLTKYVSRSMMLNRRGRVTNILSIIDTTGSSGRAGDLAAKASLAVIDLSPGRYIARRTNP